LQADADSGLDGMLACIRSDVVDDATVPLEWWNGALEAVYLLLPQPRQAEMLVAISRDGRPAAQVRSSRKTANLEKQRHDVESQLKLRRVAHAGRAKALESYRQLQEEHTNLDARKQALEVRLAEMQNRQNRQ
jgi:hypothetical protein